MGDIPFFYRAERKNNYYILNNFMKRIGSDIVRTNSSYIDILDVVPVFMRVASRFSITRTGYKYGLKTKWASRRPIVIPSHLEIDRTRITNKIRHKQFHIELAHVEGVGSLMINPFKRKGHIKRFLDFLGLREASLNVGQFTFATEEKEIKGSIEFNMKYLSAWIKIYDTDIKGSGFIRIWDYAPRVITNKMLNEAYSLLQKYCKAKFQK